MNTKLDEIERKILLSQVLYNYVDVRIEDGPKGKEIRFVLQDGTEDGIRYRSDSSNEVF